MTKEEAAKTIAENIETVHRLINESMVLSDEHEVHFCINFVEERAARYQHGYWDMEDWESSSYC